MKNAKNKPSHLNVLNGSRDIPFQSQEFEQDGCHHFADFQPPFHLNMTSQIARHDKMKVQYFICLLSDLFTILQSVRSEQRNSTQKRKLAFVQKQKTTVFLQQERVYHHLFFKT